LSSHSQFIVI